MKGNIHFSHATRQLSLIPQWQPLTRLRAIGRIFLVTLLMVWILWGIDTLQQQDALHLLTGGGRTLEEIPALRHAGDSTPEEKATLTDGGGRTNRGSTNENSADLKRQTHVQIFLKPLAIARFPALLILGIIAPLIVYFWNWESAIYRKVLDPYIMLLGAQAGSLIVGRIFLGEGIVPFIGLVYSILRVWQILGLIDLQMQSIILRSRVLHVILMASGWLWGLNAFFLLMHILMVSCRFFRPL